MRHELIGISLASALICGCPGDDDDTGASLTDTSGPGETSLAESSTAGESSSTGAPAVDYVTQIQPIWNSACTCHLMGPSGTMTATVLTLNAEVSYANLVDTPSEQASAIDRIEPGDPQASYLWHKLQGTQFIIGGSGTAMPQVGSLTQEQTSAIQDWIEQGAPP
jgi:hypothetical protein